MRRSQRISNNPTICTEIQSEFGIRYFTCINTWSKTCNIYFRNSCTYWDHIILVEGCVETMLHISDRKLKWSYKFKSIEKVFSKGFSCSMCKSFAFILNACHISHLQFGVVNKPCGLFFGHFWSPSPFVDHFIKKAYVVIWSFGKPLPLTFHMVYQWPLVSTEYSR